MRKKLTATITALALALTVFAVPVSAASGDNLIKRVGAKDRTASVGQEFELEVREGRALNDNDIKWTSSNTSVVKYAESDRYDDEMEFKAVKKGKATISAKNLKTGGKIYFYVTVKEKSKNIYISRIGKATKYIEWDDDLDLKVTKGSNLKASQIKWTISNTKLLRFENNDNVGQEAEVEARGKSGTVKVTAHNLKTGGKLVYTVKITPEYDD